MAKNFYIVLGISRDADPSQIREAHRRLVRLYHPDTGDGSVERFTEVQEAYETLSDETQRRDYDNSLSEPSGITGPTGTGRDPQRVTPPGVPTTQVVRRTRPYMGRTSGLWSAVDEFFEAFVPGVFTSGRTASRRKDLYVEIVLESDEAARGGLFPLEVPVRESCRQCGGDGYIGMFLCPQCGGAGTVRGRRDIEISMPAGVTDGTVARLSLEDIGLRGVDLNVLVTIRP